VGEFQDGQAVQGEQRRASAALDMAAIGTITPASAGSSRMAAKPGMPGQARDLDVAATYVQGEQRQVERV
jgi:hypothetical protein